MWISNRVASNIVLSLTPLHCSLICPNFLFRLTKSSLTLRDRCLPMRYQFYRWGTRSTMRDRGQPMRERVNRWGAAVDPGELRSNYKDQTFHWETVVDFLLSFNCYTGNDYSVSLANSARPKVVFSPWSLSLRGICFAGSRVIPLLTALYHSGICLIIFCMRLQFAICRNIDTYCIPSNKEGACNIALSTTYKVHLANFPDTYTRRYIPHRNQYNIVGQSSVIYKQTHRHRHEESTIWKV